MLAASNHPAGPTDNQEVPSERVEVASSADVVTSLTQAVKDLYKHLELQDKKVHELMHVQEQMNERMELQDAKIRKHMQASGGLSDLVRELSAPEPKLEVTVEGKPDVQHPDKDQIEAVFEPDLLESGAYDEVCLSASLWDIPIVLGRHPVDNAAALMMLALLLINIGCQGLFTTIVVSDLSEPQVKIGDISDLKLWRRTIAHDVRFFNDRSQQSLAARVCKGDAGLELANDQAARFSELSRYLGTGNATFFAIGPALSMLALLTFLLMTSKEVDAILLQLCALCSIGTGPTSISHGKSGLIIKQLSMLRKCLCLFFAIVRLVILGLLIAFGSLYVLYTVNLGDLILNCVALEIILNLDELIFEALSPRTVRKLLKKLPRLSCVKLPTYKTVDLLAVFEMLWVSGVLLIFFCMHLGPYLHLLVEARDALCAGDQDFVFTVDGAGVPAWTYPEGITDQHHNEQLEFRNFPDGGSSKRARAVATETERSGTYADRVVDVLLQQFGRPYHSSATACTIEMCFDLVTYAGGQLTKAKDDAPSCCLAQKVRVPLVKPGQFSVLAKSKETLLDATALWNPSCADQLDMPGAYTPMMRNAVGDVISWESCGIKCPLTRPMCVDGKCIEPFCKDLEPYCTESGMAGVRARQFCAMTCKCHEPRSSLSLGLPKEGCGTSCYRFGGFRENLKAIPCVDMQKDDPKWQGFVEQFMNSSTTWPTDWRFSAQKLAEDMKKLGCGLFNSTEGFYGTIYFFNINLCAESSSWYPVKPLSYFCPVACGCRKGDPHCPDSCPSRTDSEPLCPSYQSNMNFPASGMCPMVSSIPAVL